MKAIQVLAAFSLVVVSFGKIISAHATGDVDHHWLPDLTGLPPAQTETEFQSSIANVPDGSDEACAAVPKRLRAMFFFHFKEFNELLRKQGHPMEKADVSTWAHVLAMILQESEGDSTDVTDMNSSERGTGRAMTDLAHWNTLLTLNERIRYNSQTNYGLTQASPDRLNTPFSIQRSQLADHQFMSQAPNKTQLTLNTSIATRRLIWLYMDFARGRIEQSEGFLSQTEAHAPKYAARLAKGELTALDHCGTRYLFKEGTQGEEAMEKLRKAMASIAYCSLGDHTNGYGNSEAATQCFAKWLTLCPALNVDVATLTPLSYFQTRHAQPVCTDALNHIRNEVINSH